LQSDKHQTEASTGTGHTDVLQGKVMAAFAKLAQVFNNQDGTLLPREASTLCLISNQNASAAKMLIRHRIA
jgi:hypothetical protein